MSAILLNVPNLPWLLFCTDCLFLVHLAVCALKHQFLHYYHHHQSLKHEGRWGTTDDFATSFLHFSLFSTALWDLPNSRPVHSLILSSHLFLCLPCLLPPFTVPCKMVLARPDDGFGQTWWTGHMTIPLQFASLRSSGGLRVVQLPAGSWHGLPRSYNMINIKCIHDETSINIYWAALPIHTIFIYLVYISRSKTH